MRQLSGGGGWGVMFYIWIGVGYISVHICQNPISSAFTICAFIIYKFYLKKNCNDTHTKLFRNEVYQIPITYFKIIFKKDRVMDNRGMGR